MQRNKAATKHERSSNKGPHNHDQHNNQQDKKRTGSWPSTTLIPLKTALNNPEATATASENFILSFWIVSLSLETDTQFSK
jgi:hypothetical protein